MQKNRGDKQLMVPCAGLLIQSKAYSFAMFTAAGIQGGTVRH